MSGQLVQLKISGGEKEFTAPINPSSYNQSYGVNYNSDGSADGNPDRKLSYKETPSQVVNFDLMLDDTGVIYESTADTSDVITQIKNLKGIVYDYKGDIHHPNTVTLTWGNNFKDGDKPFKCVLTSMKIDFTLFAPSGAPLRAKISLSFKQTDVIESTGNNSPDMTHHRIVKEGDTLPIMCNEIYNDTKYYIHVARANNLASFRRLKPGTTLVFPPLVNTPQE